MSEKKVKKKWTHSKFGAMPVPLKPFDLDPVTDVIVRKAIGDGVKGARSLSFYRTAVDWFGYPKGTIAIAGKIEPGRPFSFWTPKGPPKLEKDDRPSENRTKAIERKHHSAMNAQPERLDEPKEIAGSMYCRKPIVLSLQEMQSNGQITLRTKSGTVLVNNIKPANHGTGPDLPSQRTLLPRRSNPFRKI